MTDASAETLLSTNRYISKDIHGWPIHVIYEQWQRWDDDKGAFVIRIVRYEVPFSQEEYYG